MMNKLLLLRCGGAVAAAASVLLTAVPAHAAQGQLPPERQAGPAAFVSGGIGEAEAQSFEAASKRYPLVVELFAASGGQRGEYTADAQVKITDAKGRVVLDEKADGPFMLVRLPAGRYRIGAVLNGHSLAERSVQLSDSGHAKTTFVFPQG